MKTYLGISVGCRVIKDEVALDLWRNDPVSGFKRRALLSVAQAKKLAEMLAECAANIECEKICQQYKQPV